MKFSCYKNIRNAVVGAALAVASATALSSCNHFDESLPPCPQGLELRFVYDYNMEFANAFPSQVDCLTLFVYDGQGNFVTTRTVTDRENLSDENWRMTLDLPEGDYHIFAYGGMACPDASFSFNSVPAPGSNMTALEVELDPGLITSPLGNDLHPLFYGSLDVTVPPYAPDTDYVKGTVEMMKDTNNVRILLSDVGGSTRDADFNYTVTAANTRFNYLNSLLDVPASTFYPWTRGEVEAGDRADGETRTIAFAEFSLSRLMANAASTLTVTAADDGHVVLEIPLIRILLLLKSQHFDSMGAQEFLDRESRWNMVFFLDSSIGGWLQTRIIINDWIVRINDFEA